jgi:hypothetical protein
MVYGDNVARFRPRTYTGFFVCSDVIALILQAVGGALTSIADDDQRSLQQTGINIMIAGLAFQVASLFLFIVLGSEFALRVHRSPKSEFSDFSGLRQSRKWTMFIYCTSLA